VFGIIARVLVLAVALAGLGWAIVHYRKHLSEEEAARQAEPQPEPGAKGKLKGPPPLPRKA
jgi:hypothetical protein